MTRAEELQAIFKRHFVWDRAFECNDATKQCHADRGTLLAEIDRLREALEELSAGDYHSSMVREIARDALEPAQ